MSKNTKQNTLIGRKCLIDFACRWKGILSQFQAEEKATYEKREDWNKTGEIVAFDQEEHKVMVLRDDTGSVEQYYKGEVTITGPAANPEAETADLLRDILAELKTIACDVDVIRGQTR